MKELGYGENYKYAHSYEGNFVNQQYLPAKIKNKRIWKAGNSQQELSMLERLRKWWDNRYDK